MAVPRVKQGYRPTERMGTNGVEGGNWPSPGPAFASAHLANRQPVG